MSDNGRILTPTYQPPPTATLSSQERSRLLDALIAQHNRMGQIIEAQGKQITALTVVTDDQLDREKDYNALTGDHSARVADHELRVDGIERRTAVLNTSLVARLRWLLTRR